MKVLVGRVVFALVVTGLVLAGLGVEPGVAGAQGCPEASPSYTDACGPTFVLPGWGDADGWSDPSQYSTIQLADVNGDGRDELIGRNDEGLEIWWFDTSVGQWRPQVDANGTPVALTAFASPAPGETPATDWTKPEYYSTIQTADLNGDGASEILARFADGMHVYRYTPPAGTKNINGGTWSLVPGTNQYFPTPPFSDQDGWNDPSLYLTIRTGHFDQSNPSATVLIGRSHSGLEGYEWVPSFGWSLLPADAPPSSSAIFADAGCGTPSCYAAFRVAQDTQGGSSFGLVVGRTGNGLDVLNAQGGNWESLPGSAQFTAPGPVANGVFSDVPGGPDCPFAGGGGNGDCLGSSPSYYETLNAADFNGDGNDEVFARTANGLRAYTYNGLTSDGPPWTALPTLTALGGAASSVQPGEWGSIRTGDILGNNRDQVLALDSNGLEAYSYQPSSQTWSQLPGSLGLTGDWLTNPSYYSTIQVGDVDGDGHADVVARGPFGIRTWFYDRRAIRGWSRYLPGGYQQFPGTPTMGQLGAFDALNKLALNKGAITSGTIRDVWTTPANQSDLPTLLTTLSSLQTSLAGSLVGKCSNETNLAPPKYSACTPPAGIGAADWTTVVNEALSEAYFAEQVVGHFSDVQTIQQKVFESQSGALPAIGNDLQLNGASGNTADFNAQAYFAGGAGIAASIAGAVPGLGELSAALWVTSEVFSMLPSASPTATSSFSTTYDGLIRKLATAQDEMTDAWTSQLQQVLGDQGLLNLVGQLHSKGTWKLDIPGMLSASRQGFALETYQTLLPTVYQRYAITNCTTVETYYEQLTCEPPTGQSVIAGSNGLAATWLGPPPDINTCAPTSVVPTTGFAYIDCDYGDSPGTVPDSLASTVWGTISDTCNYQPGNPNTVWAFGCALGVGKATSIAADSPGWMFTTTTGHPDILQNTSVGAAVRALPGVVRASGAARTRLGRLRFAGRLFLPPKLRLTRLRVGVERILFDDAHRKELALSGLRSRLRPVTVRDARAGVFTSRARSRPSVRLSLRRLDAHGTVRLDLQLAGVRIRDIRALCTMLPAKVSLAGRPLELETRLLLRDRGVTKRITLRQRWRCVRDREGEFGGIRPIKPKPLAARPGLAVRLGAPRILASGRQATVLVTVTNRRRARPSRVVSSLWHLRITGTAGGPTHTISLKQLRARRSRTLRLSLRVPRATRRRVCVQVAAGADSARPTSARRCVRITSSPPVTG